MKKLKELIYWIVFVIYEELIMAMLIFGKFPKTAPLIILLTLPFAIGLNILTSIFGKKWKKSKYSNCIYINIGRMFYNVSTTNIL